MEPRSIRQDVSKDVVDLILMRRVRDSDTCPNSATGIIVDQTGCEVEKQINEENDATRMFLEDSFSTIVCGGCCFILILLL